MTYTKISPLGPRNGPGTYDAIYDNEKYKTIEEAMAANDYVCINFVSDENNTIHFEVYNSTTPDEKKYMQLNFQRFPFGVDVLDDGLVIQLAETLLK